MFFLKIPKRPLQAEAPSGLEVNPLPILEFKLKKFHWEKGVVGGLSEGPYSICNKNSVCLEDRLCLLWKGTLFNKKALIERFKLEWVEDGDVVLAAFEYWGRDCITHLEGDFAFVMWQVEKNEILAARDAMGCFTLYYGQTADHFIFADDARLVARAISPSGRLSRRGLLMWALNAYEETVPLFEDVSGLAPAEAIQVNSERMHTWRYWNPWETVDVRYAKTDHYADHLEELLRTCVADRCFSGEVGSMLSGGLDSATVTAIAAQHDPALVGMSYQFKTLKACDEWPKAAALMSHLNLRHLPLDAESHWLLQDCLPPPWQEDPFQSWDVLTLQAINQLQTMGKRILVTGHGGDNMFSGFSQALLAGMALPSKSWQSWKTWYRALAKTGFSLPRGAYRYLFRPKYQAQQQRYRRWPDRFSWIPSNACKQLFPQGFPWLPRHSGHRDPQRQAMIWMTTQFTMGVRRAIHWYHRLGYEAKIQVQHPLFDRRLAEFMIAIPPECVRMGKTSKGLLRLAMNRVLPQVTLAQQEKPSLAAFYYQGIAIEKHLIKHFTQDMYLEKLGLVDATRIKHGIRKYLQGDPNFVLAWFLPAVLAEAWLRVALEQGYAI